MGGPLAENRFGRYPDRIDYTPLTSCLTINLLLADGQIVGTHLVASKRDEIPQILKGMRALVGDRTVTGIYTVGVLRVWSSDNLTEDDQRYQWQKVLKDTMALTGFSETVHYLETPGENDQVSVMSGEAGLRVSLNSKPIPSSGLTEITPDLFEYM